jgi:lipoate-protein ligase A
MPQKNKPKKMEEIDLIDTMLTTLVDLLEEKGVLTHEEWEAKIEKKLKEKEKLVSFRDLKDE